MNLENKIIEASKYIENKVSARPKIGLILGSGLGAYGESLQNVSFIEYKDIPNFPTSTVQGHKGRFVINEDVICMQGRFHFYEGYKMEDVTFPIRVMKNLGVEIILLTNASGGVNKEFKPGDLMVITDHLNLMGTNPLIGKNLDSFGERFPDMSTCYTPEYVNTVIELGKDLGLKLQTGVYAGFTGPSYETPAEVRMARILGADAVGMSTVPEAIVARHCGMKVIGISCITNMAAGVSEIPLCHEEVMQTSERVKCEFIKLVDSIVNRLINNWWIGIKPYINLSFIVKKLH